MRRFFTLLLFTSLVLGVQAKDNGTSKIDRVAMNAMQSMAKKSGLTITNLRRVSETETLVIYEDDNSLRCITTNDSDNPRVIGYSTAKHSDDNPGYNMFLNAAKQAAYTNVAAKEYAELAQNADVDSMVTTLWNQSKPYNNLCPAYLGANKYPTGCVATAMAQIMKYHSYPEKGEGYNGYSFTPTTGTGVYLSADFSDTYYDWANMIDIYSDEAGYTDEQATAVATLMYHCGVAVSMQYTPSGSGALMAEAATALRNNFSYNENIGIHYRDYYSDKEWMKLMYEELDNGRPVLYAGTDASSGGHCFVIDGYDDNGLFHVNWGWGGNDNGYYDLALLSTPDMGSFSLYQMMLTGFAKPDVEIEHHSEVVGDGTLTLKQMKRGVIPSCGNVFNMSDFSFTGSTAIVLLGTDSLYVLKEEANVKKATYFAVNVPSTMCVLPTGLPNGTYRIYPAAKDSLENDWHPIHYKKDSVNSYILTYTDGSYTITPETDASWQADIKNTKATGIAELQSAASTSKDIVVYDINGQKIARVKNRGELKGIQHNGVLIVRQGDKIRKMIK